MGVLMTFYGTIIIGEITKIILMKIRILFLFVLFLTFVSVVPLQAQTGLLLLEKGSVKVIGPERTRLLRKPGAKIVLQANDRVQT
ncbi:MAG: hypothetical protein HOB42_01035, partial [Candidatus Marinimicrobia bacterium]|nr:hypothetical protein [Candidatus Neomarinimicrobiota bacterium]